MNLFYIGVYSARLGYWGGLPRDYPGDYPGDHP